MYGNTIKDIIDNQRLVAGLNISDHTHVFEGFDIDVRVRLGVLSPIFHFPKNSLKRQRHSRSPYLGSVAKSAVVIDYNSFRIFKGIAIGQKYTYGI